MASVEKCSVCGDPVGDPSRGSVCSRCLLRDALDLQGDDGTEVPGMSGVNGASSAYSTVEVPGRYSHIRDHARGGMGRVLLVHDEQLGRDIIIKELLGEARDSGAPHRSPLRPGESTPLAARFVREARITGQLEHPSIIPVHELGFRENGDLYYTMKYVQGVNLSDSLDRADGLADRLRLLPHVLNVCQAIAYAHSRGVIHRDIKPANIMVGSFGETVVLDWGLARAKGHGEKGAEDPRVPDVSVDMGAAGDSGQTTFGQVLGTPAYMAPEQAQGRGELVDERSDVYALGALLYAILTGHAPYSGENRKAIIEQAAEGAPRAVRALEPTAPVELAAMCEKAMAREPAQRYASAQELVEELQRFMAGGLVGAYNYRLSEHLRRFARRHRRVLATAAVAFILIITVVIYSYLHILGERDHAVTAQRNAVQARDEALQAREDSEREAYYSAIAYAHAKIQEGDFSDVPDVLNGQPEHFRGWEWGYLMGQCHLEEKTVQAHDGPIAAFAASEDGTIISTAGQDESLILWDGKTLNERWRYPDKIVASVLALAPDNKTLIVGRDGLVILDCQTGKTIKNTIPTRYDSNIMQEFAMSIHVSGAPEGGDDGLVRFYPTSRDLGQALFRFQNGNQVIRLNLRERQDPSFAAYEGPIVYYRLTIPAKHPDDYEIYRDMKIEIDWIAITDDPNFTPEAHAASPVPDEQPAPHLKRRAVWNFDTGTENWISSKDGAVDVSASDGKLLLKFRKTTSFSPSVRLFEPRDWDTTDAMAFSPDGTRLYVLGDSQLHVLRSIDWSELAVLSEAELVEDRRILPRSALAVSPDGAQIAVAYSADGPEGTTNYYKGFDTATLKPLWHFEESSSDTHLSVKMVKIAFDPDSSHLLCVGDGKMGLWRLADQTLQQQWRIYVDQSNTDGSAMAVWCDQTHFLAGDRNGVVARYSTQGDPLERIVLNGSSIAAVSAHDGMARVATADRKGLLKLWIPGTAALTQGAVDITAPEFIWGMYPEYSPDGKLLAVEGFGAGTTFWNMDTLERAARPYPDSEDFLALCRATDEIAVIADSGQTVRFRRLRDGVQTREFPVGPEIDWDKFSVDEAGRYMALADIADARVGNQHLKLIETLTGRVLTRDFPTALSEGHLSADGKWLAIGYTREGRVDIWKVPECTPYQQLSASVTGLVDERGIRSLRFHPNLPIIAAGTGTGKLLLWDFATGNLLHAIQAHGYGKTTLCFSPDGSRLVTGGGDGYVRVWDWRTGRKLVEFQDNYVVRGVTFSPDGNMLVSGGGDPPVRVRVAWPTSAAFLPEVQRRRTCHEHLVALDNAKLAWAIANHRAAKDDSATLTELQPYLANPATPTTCLSGGVYRPGAVMELPGCSVHETPYENPTLAACINADANENTPLMELYLARLCNSKSATELFNLALVWNQQSKFPKATIRLLKRASELAPEDKRVRRTLALAQLHTGQVNEAVEDFREGFETNHEPSAVGLALALITRGTEQDIAEALATLEAQPGTATTTYTEEALAALDKLPPTAAPQFRERIRLLLKAHVAP